MSNKKQIEEVLVEEDIGICFLIETDEQQGKLLTVPCKENFSNYTIHTAKVLSPTEKVRIAALIRKDMKYVPGKQQMMLRRAWTPKRRNMQFYYGANDQIFSFMVSRHPFERILSAYR